MPALWGHQGQKVWLELVTRALKARPGTRMSRLGSGVPAEEGSRWHCPHPAMSEIRPVRPQLLRGGPLPGPGAQPPALTRLPQKPRGQSSGWTGDVHTEAAQRVPTDGSIVTSPMKPEHQRWLGQGLGPGSRIFQRASEMIYLGEVGEGSGTQCGRAPAYGDTCFLANTVVHLLKR